MDNAELDILPSKDKLIRNLQKTIEKSWKNGMVGSDIEKWLSNFKGEIFSEDQEQKIALWLLCNFIYYNEEEVRHLCKILYKNFFHKIIIDFSLSIEEINDFMSKINYAAIGGASESGNFLLYNFRQEADLSINRFFFPSSIDSDENTIVAFLDDVTLSGTTAVKFFRNNLKGKKYKKIYYLTLFATVESVAKLQENDIEIVYCSILSERNKCFSEKSMIFSQYKELSLPAKEMASHYGKKLVERNPLGFKDGQYCFGFHYNTPNNSLPIFWSNENGWIPIFERKAKRRNERRKKFEKYI